MQTFTIFANLYTFTKKNNLRDRCISSRSRVLFIVSGVKMAETAAISVVRRNRPGTKAEVDKDSFGVQYIRCHEGMYFTAYN